MTRVILLLLLFYSPCNSYLIPSCLREESISWAAGKDSEIRAVNLTTCSYGSHRFTLDRPINSTMAIRARIISQEEDSDSTFNIQVLEIAESENGKRMFLKRKDLSGVDDSVISSPYTSLKVMVYKRGSASKAEIIFQFTLEERGCPYPFLESRLGTPLIITSEVLAEECDFAVTAVDPGAALELTSINETIPHQRHSVAVVIYDGYSSERLHRVEQSEFDSELKEHLGTSRVTVHVTNPMGREKDHEVAFITINSIEDDCRCPNGNVILNDTNIDFKYKMEKRHCFHLNCSVFLEIDEPLRHNYRMKIIPNYYEGVTNTFSIKDGMADFFNMKFIPQPRSYVSVNPKLLLVYSEGTKPTSDFIRVILVRTTETEQALCRCPDLPPSLSLTLTVDPSCPQMDCLWTFPKIESTDIPTISVESNSTHEPYEGLFLTSTHDQQERMERLEHGTQEPLYVPGEKEILEPHVVVYYQRVWRENPITGIRPKSPSMYKVTVTKYKSIIDYESACDCVNRTIKVAASSELSFSSPRFPLHYCDDLHCRTTFEAPKGYRVVFRPHKLSLQRDSDFLRIYDIIDGKEITREKYTGRYLDGFTTESRTNLLLAVFTSDGSISYDGFNSSVYAEKIEDDSVDYFDDGEGKKSGGFFWKFLFCLLVVGAIVGAVVYKKRKTSGDFSLSFAPVSFMNNGGDFDEGSVSFSLSS
ncbi:hypothetical protein PMAYCL1PPCAC_02810 [Pristionchus mayeri]|uniref:CUB domain-containing protein n=1 Tax=Pristionchus mayeri TaxID=1317129 RepID=A0AAN5C6L0_9BILA|nr:hypothetical protein PMAYCL1PPCAC_02810 [Pristionchus mayeri]